MWVPFLRFFPGNEAHKLFWGGGPKWGVLGRGQKVYVEKVYVLFSVPYTHAPKYLKARFLQCGFWPRNSQIPI